MFITDKHALIPAILCVAPCMLNETFVSKCWLFERVSLNEVTMNGRKNFCMPKFRKMVEPCLVLGLK